MSKRLEELFPGPLSKRFIRSAQKAGISDDTIRDTLVNSGAERRDLGFLGALGENIINAETPVSDALSQVPVVGGALEAVSRPLGVAMEILDLPQDILTAAFSPGEEGFLESFARGKDPSEALGVEDSLGKLATDIVLDPLTFLGGSNIAKASKLIKSERAADAAATAGKIEDVAKIDVKDFEKAKKAIDIQESGLQGPQIIDEIPKKGDDVFPTSQEAAERADDRLFDIDDLTNGLPVLKDPVYKKVAGAFVNLARAGDIAIKPTSEHRLYNQIIHAINTDKISIKELAEEAGMSNSQAIVTVVEGLRAQGSDFGRGLQQLKGTMDEVRDLIDSGKIPDDAKKVIEEMPMDKIQPEGVFRKYYKLLINKLWRGSLTGQTSTSSRNIIGQGIRTGLHAVQTALDAMIQTLPGIQRTVSLDDSMETLIRLATKKKNQEWVETLFKIDDSIEDRLYSNFVGDLDVRGAGFIDKYVRMVNFQNTWQERLFRNATLQSALRQRVKNIDEIIEQGGEIPKKALDDSIEHALEITFGANPQGKLGQSVVNVINEVPGLSLILPFPRFMINSMKFFWDFNPMGALRLLSPAQMARMARGDTQVASRAIIGSGLLGASYNLRDSEYAGEKWYELQVDGKNLDMRPFNPFAAYLFVADLAKRQRDGTLEEMSTKDILSGILSTNLRAGTGLATLDNLFGAFAGTTDERKFEEKFKTFAGEFTAGFLTPIQSITDILAGYDEQVVHDSRAEPFLGPIKRRLPGLESTLPETQLPTREGPLRKAPLPGLEFLPGSLTKQLTGIRAVDKTPEEAELDKLGFKRIDILRGTGNSKADRLISESLGPIVERTMKALMAQEKWEFIPRPRKILIVDSAVKRARSIARRQAMAKDPALFRELAQKRVSRKRRKALEDL